MDADKFIKISTAMLSILTSNRMRWSDLQAQIEKAVTDFDGSVGWYAVSVARELETQGKIKRDVGPPAFYSKA